ncbi:MAG: hypothetical protein ACI9TH_003927 [Kiritimatiellia bacterium]|jgi:hypothetical protein
MKRINVLPFLPTILTSALLCFSSHGEKIYDYAGQKAAGKEVKKIVFIGDAGTHGGRGNHEFMAGSVLLGELLHAAYPNVHAVVHSSKNWPKDLSHADAVVVSLNHGGRAANDKEIAKAVERGAGFMAIHYGVEVNKGDQGDNYIKWMGGYFEPKWSVNPWWTPSTPVIGAHPTARGVTPFALRDEWYYHMRFVEGMKGVTPVYSAVPPLNTLQGDPEKISDRGNNPDVYKAVSSGQSQHLAWAYDRPDGGRGFGFTGLHLHKNLADPGFRTLLLNGVAWVTKLDLPEKGVPSPAMTEEAVDKIIDGARAAIEAGR